MYSKTLAWTLALSCLVKEGLRVVLAVNWHGLLVRELGNAQGTGRPFDPHDFTECPEL